MGSMRRQEPILGCRTYGPARSVDSRYIFEQPKFHGTRMLASTWEGPTLLEATNFCHQQLHSPICLNIWKIAECICLCLIHLVLRSKDSHHHSYLFEYIALSTPQSISKNKHIYSHKTIFAHHCFHPLRFLNCHLIDFQLICSLPGTTTRF